jgi:hypothetical protein
MLTVISVPPSIDDGGLGLDPLTAVAIGGKVLDLLTAGDAQAAVAANARAAADQRNRWLFGGALAVSGLVAVFLVARR